VAVMMSSTSQVEEVMRREEAWPKGVTARSVLNKHHAMTVKKTKLLPVFILLKVKRHKIERFHSLKPMSQTHVTIYSRPLVVRRENAALTHEE